MESQGMPYCGEVQPSWSDWSRTKLVHLLLSAGFHQTWFNLYFLFLACVLYFSTHTFLSLSLSSLSHVGVHISFYDGIVLITLLYCSLAAQNHEVIDIPEVQTTVLKSTRQRWDIFMVHRIVKLLRHSAVFNQSLPLNPHRWLLAPCSMNSREILASYFLFHRVLYFLMSELHPSPSSHLHSSAVQPTPPFFALHQQPTKILMNPIWPTSLCQQLL